MGDAFLHTPSGFRGWGQYTQNMVNTIPYRRSKNNSSVCIPTHLEENNSHTVPPTERTNDKRVTLEFEEPKAGPQGLFHEPAVHE